MELEDVILSTIAEMKNSDNDVAFKNSIEPKEIQVKNIEVQVKKIENKVVVKENEVSSLDSQIIFLSSLRERLLVLFEGFQSPTNDKIEVKIDMTLNFLEYALATIDTRTIQLEKELISESI